MALALSLAIHELATNAAKYGALTSSAGRVEVSWQADSTAGLKLRWIESGGPVVITPDRRGFGSTLIERALAIETGGQSVPSFDPAGVTCLITIPPSALERSGVRQEAKRTMPDETAKVLPTPPTRTKRILVVEDSAMVVMDIEGTIADLGWEVVGPAYRLADTIRLAGSADCDAALFDINLNGEMSWDAAAILQDRNIPFIFTTGYDGATILPARFAAVPVVSKPFRDEDIGRALHALFD